MVFLSAVNYEFLEAQLPGGSVSYLRGDNLTEGKPLNSITPLKAVLNIH
ncbi:MAG TPA: hypothetical protein VMM38_07790 [Aridibacter sp.]|nr:hypothetical protein [Aridibacter sp.]